MVVCMQRFRRNRNYLKKTKKHLYCDNLEISKFPSQHRAMYHMYDTLMKPDRAVNEKKNGVAEVKAHFKYTLF